MSDGGPIGRFTRKLGHARVQSQNAEREQPGPAPKAQEKKKQLTHARAQSSGWGTQPTEKKRAIAVAKGKFDKLAEKSKGVDRLPTREDAIRRRHAQGADEHFDVAGSESSTDQDAGSEVETSIDQLRRDQSSEKSADMVSPRSHGKIDMPKPLDFSILPPLPSSPRPNTAEAAEGERAIIEQFRNYQPITGGPSIEIGNTAEDIQDIQTAITTGRVTPPPSTTTTTTTTTTQSSTIPQAERKPPNRRPLQESGEKDQPVPLQTPRAKPLIGHRPAPTPKGDDKSRAKPQEAKKPGDPS
jgi:hypothetical protein